MTAAVIDLKTRLTTVAEPPKVFDYDNASPAERHAYDAGLLDGLEELRVLAARLGIDTRQLALTEAI